MFLGRYNDKNQRKCVPCVPSCVPLQHNGTHAEPLPQNLFSQMCTMCTFARVRVRESVFFTGTIFIQLLNEKMHDEKVPRVREFILMVHMVNISLKALLCKPLLCVPFSANGTQKTAMVNIAFQVIDFNIENVCTIVLCGFFACRGVF